MNKKLPFAGSTKTKPLGKKAMTRSQVKTAAAAGKPFAPKRKMKDGGCLGCGGKMKK